MAMAIASFATDPLADDPFAFNWIHTQSWAAATLVQNLGYAFFTTIWPITDIVAVYSSLQVVASAAATATLYKISGIATAGLIGTGTAISSALTLTATDYTAGQLHDCAAKLTAAELVGLPAGTIVGIQVSNDQATTGLRGLQFSFLTRKGGYRTTDNGGKFSPAHPADCRF